MKKYVLIFSLLLSSISFSQLHSVGFQLGGMGTGLGNAFWSGDAKMKIDFTGGLNYQYRFTSHFTLGANLEYTQFGARIPVYFLDLSGNLIAQEYSSYDWNYISVPILFGFEMGGRVRFKPKIGIVPSVLSRMVYNFKPYDGSTLTPTKTSYYSDAKKLDFGSLVGFDLSVPFHAGVIFLGVDFRYSLTKVNNDNLFIQPFNESYRHRSLGAIMGVRFSLGKPEVEGPSDLIDDPVD